MTYHLISSDKLKVILTYEDLVLLGLDPEEDTCPPGTVRQALLYLLDEARESVGFDPQGPKLLIEVFPGQDEGCMIYFTELPPEEDAPYISNAYTPVVFAFEDSEVMIRACAGLFSTLGHRLYKSSLYTLGGEYQVIVYPFDGSEGPAAGYLSEFGRRLTRSDLAAAYIEEHGTPILTEKAVDTISYYFDR